MISKYLYKYLRAGEQSMEKHGIKGNRMEVLVAGK